MKTSVLAARSLAILSLTGGAAPALAKVPQVVTDIPAIHALTAQVMGDLGAPTILLEQGGNAHNYQLKPSQAAALQGADLVFWIGPSMTPWLDRAIKGVQVGGKPVSLLAAPGTHVQDFGGAAHADEHDHAAEGHEAEGHDHEAEGHEAEGHEAEGHDHATEGHEAEQDGDAHAHTGLDPHAWLTPENAEVWLSVIAAELAAADPEHAATYAANAAAAKAETVALDAELKATLAPVADRPFVVFHDAYGYFATHYGLSVAGAVALGDATDPGAAHLAALRDTLRAKGVICAFPEIAHDPKRIDLLLEGTAVKRGGTLDPAGAALPYGRELYATLMRGMAQTLVACLTP